MRDLDKAIYKTFLAADMRIPTEDGVYIYPVLVEWAVFVGLSPEALANLNWGVMLQANLLPVTLDNVVGGGVLVALAYWFVYRRAKR